MISSNHLDTTEILLTSADIPGAFAALNVAGIELWNIQQREELSVSFCVRRRELAGVFAIVQRRGEQVKVIGSSGLLTLCERVLRRPVLLAGMAFLLILTLWLPSKVLFLRVEGNKRVPGRLILEEAANCGLSFGTGTAQVRSEEIKNALLLAIPELKWVGVNTYGCVAVITVQERISGIQEVIPYSVSSIVASADGVVESVVAESGTVLCKPGDAVLRGQTLISGFTGDGSILRAGRAKGEVIALVQRELTVLAPQNYVCKGQKTVISQKFGWIFGKKRINFYKGSGILPPGCARIYSDMYVTLPGGFVLPTGFFCETWVTFEEQRKWVLCDAELSKFAESYLQTQIMSAEESVRQEEDVLVLEGTYFCREQIGITKIEETLWGK